MQTIILAVILFIIFLFLCLVIVAQINALDDLLIDFVFGGIFFEVIIAGERYLGQIGHLVFVGETVIPDREKAVAVGYLQRFVGALTQNILAYPREIFAELNGFDGEYIAVIAFYIIFEKLGIFFFFAGGIGVVAGLGHADGDGQFLNLGNFFFSAGGKGAVADLAHAVGDDQFLKHTACQRVIADFLQCGRELNRFVNIIRIVIEVCFRRDLFHAIGDHQCAVCGAEHCQELFAVLCQQHVVLYHISGIFTPERNVDRGIDAVKRAVGDIADGSRQLQPCELLGGGKRLGADALNGVGQYDLLCFVQRVKRL